MNGEVLRKLEKSGIEYLTFANENGSMRVPTEGFLAGWVYDELKSRGTAGRRFEYSLAMDRENASWAVAVEGSTYELSEDPLSPLYLTGIMENWIETDEEVTAEAAAETALVPVEEAGS